VITLAIIQFVVPVAFIVVFVCVAFLSRNQPLKSKDRFSWRLPLCVVVGGSIVLLSLMVYGPDAPLLYVFLIAPIICLICLVLLVAAVIRKKTRQSLSMLLTLVAFLAASGALIKNHGTLRPSLRWLLWSRGYKAEVLAQPAPANGELRHIEWDGWGGTPVGDWTAYVVFDPTDSLSAAAKSRSHGKFSGIPCNVDRVRRLENHWYSVELAMNEWWDRCD